MEKKSDDADVEDNQDGSREICSRDLSVLSEYAIIDVPVPEEQKNSRVSPISEMGRQRHSAEDTDHSKIVDTLSNTQKDGQDQDVVMTEQKSSVAPVKIMPLCPAVNCPEKIIICLDLNEEMDTTTFRSRAGDKYSGLDLATRAIKMFIMHKNQINPAHQFALLTFQEQAVMIHELTSDTKKILGIFDDNKLVTEKSGQLDLSHLFETVCESVSLPEVPQAPEVIPPPFIVRVLLIYGRSQSVPASGDAQIQRTLESSPYFFTDVLYIHEAPSKENKCEEIFAKLCDLDHNGMSYILAASKYTTILNNGAQLLAHPLQRPRQEDASYKIGSLPTVSVSQVEQKVVN